jgi:NAD(P)H dehydrogenase (quinone)
MTIAVTGGNGEFGRAVLDALSTRTQEPRVATVRDPGKAEPQAGVEYRPGDFDNQNTLRASLADVDTVLLNATFFGAEPALREPRVSAAIRAAAEAGVGRIVLTSWLDLDHAALPAVQDYRRLEAQLKTAGPAWTILRLGYGQAMALARDVVWGKAGGELVAPAAGAQVTPSADLTKFSLPTAITQELIEMYADFRSDWASTPSPTLGNLIGHSPIPGIQAVRYAATRFPTG